MDTKKTLISGVSKTAPDQFPIEVRSDTFQKCVAVFLFLLLAGIALWLLLCLLYPAQFPAKDNFAAMNQKDKLPYYAGAAGAFVAALYVLLGTFRYRLYADAWGVTQGSAFATNRAAWTEIASYKLEPTGGTRVERIEPVLRNARGDDVLRPCAHPVITLDGTERALFWNAIMERIDTKRDAVIQPKF